MKVIKPQTLVFQHAPTQIGSLPRMGFSVGYGFRLSDPRILVHEANVWAAVKAAPSSVPLCELSLPKKHAEWLLVGHSTSIVDVPELKGTPWEWVANVKWGDISKTVSCKSKVGLDGVAKLSMDHASTAAHAKHVGVDVNKDSPLMLMGRLGAGADCSAAMSPLDKRWPERQKWMPAFESTPEAMALDGTHMGWPEKTDLRLFQQAYSNQWSRHATWPDNVEYALHGFGLQCASVKGRTPAMKPQLMVCRQLGGRLEYIIPELSLQTVWLLPDNDVGVLWWHGEVAIDYVLDNSIVYAICMIAQSDKPVDEDHMRRIAEIRLDYHNNEIFNESDYPLMPPVGQSIVWEQVLGTKDHPNNLAQVKSYDQIADELRQSWQNTMQLDKDLKEQMAAKKSGDGFVSKDYSPIYGPYFNYALSKPGIQGAPWREYLINGEANEVRKLFKKTIRDQDLSEIDIKDWQMEEVCFERCRFSGVRFIHNEFKKIDFLDCQFDRVNFVEVQWEHGEISDSKINEMQWCQVGVVGVNVNQVESVDWRFISCSLNDVLFDGGSHLGVIQDDCHLDSMTYLNARFKDNYWKKIKLVNAGVVACDFSGLLIAESLVEKFSVVDGCFDRLNCSKSQFNSFVLAKKSSLLGAEFSGCIVENGCWLGISADDLLVKNCSMKQINLEGVSAERSKWHNSLLNNAHLKDASMVASQWNFVALCGANLCAVDFSEANLKDCNLVGANLAWSSLPMLAKMQLSNVMSNVNFFPRRS